MWWYYFFYLKTFVCSEVAFGYKGLQIQLFYTAGNLSTLFKVKYSLKVTDTFDCVEVRCCLTPFSAWKTAVLDSLGQNEAE